MPGNFDQVSLFDDLDLSRPAVVKQETQRVRTADKTISRERAVPSREVKKSSKPVRKQLGWAAQMPNADEDYAIPDEVLYDY